MSEPTPLVKVVCPSYKRPGRVTTFGALANVTLAVSQKEYPLYREHYPDVEIVQHPNIVGYPMTAQWILEKFKNVFLVDDDIQGVHRKWMEQGSGIPSLVDPVLAYHIVQNTAAMAKEVGAYLFGFSHTPNPVTYLGFKPFQYGRFINNGYCGILDGGGLYFRPDIFAEDYWLSLYNFYRNRFSFVEDRFVFINTGTFQTSGGVSGLRNLKVEEESYNMLKTLFGDAVISKPAPPSHIRKLANPFEKMIRLPY